MVFGIGCDIGIDDGGGAMRGAGIGIALGICIGAEAAGAEEDDGRPAGLP